MLSKDFFYKEADELAKLMLGKLLCSNVNGQWRKARVIETEAYFINEKASHASLGYTYKRRALFEKLGGNIYMYHSRGGASFNIGANGEGNAVLIKSAIVHLDNSPDILEQMRNDNLIINHRTGIKRYRQYDMLASGQTILCKSLNLTISKWDCKEFDKYSFFVEDTGYKPSEILITTRLGIPKGRDEDLPLRFIDSSYTNYTTKGKSIIKGSIYLD